VVDVRQQREKDASAYIFWLTEQIDISEAGEDSGKGKPAGYVVESSHVLAFKWLRSSYASLAVLRP
jgi:hypothetical protein